MALDRVGEFIREKTPRRLLALATFAGLLVAFRGLFVLLIFFVAFQRSLDAASATIAARTRVKKKAALLGLVAGFASALGLVVLLSAGRISRAILHARDTVPERVAAMQHSPLVTQVRERIPGVERWVESASHYASDALHALSAVGHIVLYALIGLILALVFELEKDELVHFRRSLDPRTLFGTLARWVEHLADAVSVTIQLQMVVAACNTVLTLPLLIWLGIPHKIALMSLIFVSGLVPVIGNIVSGVVLSILAHQQRGWLGVGLFVGLTFVLHKLEAYYLNPRLTARHVKLPGFLLVVSLLGWEHLIGFVGLFVSFPFLFVAGRIRLEMRAEDAAESAADAVVEAPRETPASVPRRDPSSGRS